MLGSSAGQLGLQRNSSRPLPRCTAISMTVRTPKRAARCAGGSALNARLLVVLCTFGTRGMAFDTIVQLVLITCCASTKRVRMGDLNLLIRCIERPPQSLGLLHVMIRNYSLLPVADSVGWTRESEALGRTPSSACYAIAGSAARACACRVVTAAPSGGAAEPWQMKQ